MITVLLRNIIFFIIGLLIYGCADGKQVEIAFGIDNCQSCNMVIDKQKEAAGLLIGSEFYPSCNPICMIHEVNRLKISQIKADKIYISDYTTGELIPAIGAEVTFFVGRIQTVMNYGIVAFADVTAAEALAKSYSGELLNYNKFRARFENPDKIFTLEITNDGILPSQILADKNDVILLKLDYQLDQIDELIIHGYQDINPVKLGAGESPVEVKLVTDKPGAGFPIELSNYTGISGRLIVQGTHTAEEAL